MKVVYLNPTGQIGGAEKVLLDIFACLRESGTHYRPFLVTGADGPLVEKASADGVPVIVLPFPPGLARLGDGGAGGPAGSQVSRWTLFNRMARVGGDAALYLLRLRQTLKQLAPDIIHTNGFKMHVLGACARPRRVPVVWHIHDYVGARPLMARIMPRLAHRCSAMIAVSNSVAEDVRAVCGERTPVHTIYNAIDLNRYSPFGPKLDLDRLAGMPPAPDGTVKVGLLATMARWKGHEVFLKAISSLPKEMPIRAYVVGGALYQTDGSQYSIPELRRIAHQLGVDDRVGFTGYISDPASAMRACDIIVHASMQPEPFGLVIIEAMACGKAVIVSNAGGAAELIEPGKNALPHAAGNGQELASCIEWLTLVPELKKRLGEAGRSTAERRFHRARLGAELLPVYNSLLEQPDFVQQVELNSRSFANR